MSEEIQEFVSSLKKTRDFSAFANAQTSLPKNKIAKTENEPERVVLSIEQSPVDGHIRFNIFQKLLFCYTQRCLGIAYFIKKTNVKTYTIIFVGYFFVFKKER